MRVQGSSAFLFVFFILPMSTFCVGTSAEHAQKIDGEQKQEQSSAKTLAVEVFLGTELIGEIGEHLRSTVQSAEFTRLVKDGVFRKAIGEWLAKGKDAGKDAEEAGKESLEESLRENLLTPKVREALAVIAGKIAKTIAPHDYPSRVRASIYYPREHVRKALSEAIYKVIPFFAAEIATAKFGSGTRATLARVALAKAGSITEESTGKIAVEVKEDVRKVLAKAEKLIIDLMAKEITVHLSQEVKLTGTAGLVAIPAGGTALARERPETTVAATVVAADGKRTEIVRHVLPSPERAPLPQP